MSGGETKDSLFKKYPLALLSGGILAVFIVLVVFLNARAGKEGGVVFPAGVNYLAPGQDAPPETGTPDPAFDFKSWETGEWVDSSGVNYAFTYQRPMDLFPLYFPGDLTEKVAFTRGDVPAELNIMLLVETISDFDSNLVGSPEKYVSQYWKQFSGLKDVDSVKEFENSNGLEGYRVVYVDEVDQPTTTHAFLVLPGDKDHLVHVINVFPSGAEGIFDRIVDSVAHTK